MERMAYDAVVGGKAALLTYRSDHPQCIFDAVTGLSNIVSDYSCVLNNRLTAAKDAIIDAAEIYCSGTDFESGGACNPLSKSSPGYAQAVAKLRAAITSYNQVYTDFKTAINGQ
ncbi:MAG: hypothetical protein ACREQ5_06375 [Candidatus Dormibacteria bacterium]